MKIKVDVEQVRIGMYVAELDRPWLESPFLFQGFVIETDEDLETLRKHCNYVFIDDTKSRDDDEVREMLADLGRSSDGEARDSRAQRAAQSSVESFRDNIKRAVETFRKSTTGVIKFFNDARLGKSVETEDARAIVGELLTEITHNTNTALWLTRLKSRDEPTAAHCLNVSILALAFARHLGYPHEWLEIVGLGGLLHDVGVARTPPEILNKPGNLTQEEFEIVKKHPRDGYNVLKLTKEIPEAALDIILHHHERVNGSGYPEGLEGDDVREAVRIVAIADVYDSMTSDRVYRKAMAPQDALTAMHKRAELDFGKRLMEEFIKCVGIYPIGSLVVLNTGALGVVVSSNPDARLRPLILLVRDEQGRDVLPRKLVNLNTLAQQRGQQAWAISRVVNPADYGVDVGAIATEEMRFSR